VEGCDAKSPRGLGYGERVGAGIGKFVGMVATPQRRAMEAASNSRDYKCQQCGRSYKMNNLKRNMIKHLSHEANKACLDHYSKSSNKRERDWVSPAQIGSGQDDPENDQEVVEVGVQEKV